MFEHHARTKLRKTGKGYTVTFPKHLADRMELEGNEHIEWTVTEYSDGSVECTAIMTFEE